MRNVTRETGGKNIKPDPMYLSVVLVWVIVQYIKWKHRKANPQTEQKPERKWNEKEPGFYDDDI